MHSKIRPVKSSRKKKSVSLSQKKKEVNKNNIIKKRIRESGTYLLMQMELVKLEEVKEN